MSDLDATVWIFDPVMPFEKVRAKDPGIDTWHDQVLISQELRDKLSQVTDAGKQSLNVSGGVRMNVQSVEIGLQIGVVQLPKILALVVDEGIHDLVLGSNVFGQIFKASQASKYLDSTEESVRFTSFEKEDPNALSFELYPVDTPFPIKRLERSLQHQRTLYNIGLIASKEVQVEGLSAELIDRVIDDDEGIPENLVLQLSFIDRGSIWVSLKSGSQATLKYLGSLFNTGASAKLSEQLAESKKAEIEVSISEATRNAVANQVISENEKLSAENIRATYETWRDELRSQLSFLDELIEHANDDAVKEQLQRRKNEAILQMADQQMVPVVRNVPGSYLSYDGDDVPKLPEPKAK